jgi:mannose-6-phosphate isomerase-like protein (cupin superfamily)
LRQRRHTGVFWFFERDDGIENKLNMQKVNLTEKFGLFSEHWSPKIVGELNGQHVKLVKIKGEFVFHKHDHEDELFMVVQGWFNMEFEDHSVRLEAGEFLIVPRGVVHRPVAPEECSILLFEPAGTLNTGDAVGSEMTKAVLDKI